MDDVIKLTRAEFYEQVWTEPMQTLAARYGLSGVGLAKTCRRMNIPVPGRGYWAKKAARQPVQRVPLPTLPSTGSRTPREVTFDLARAEQQRQAQAGPVGEQMTFEKDPANAIVVSEKPTAVHPVVRATMRLLREAKARDDGLLETFDKQALDVVVARANLGRAKAIMDALVKAFKKRGWALAEPDGDKASVAVLVDGERVPFGVRERTRRLPPDPPKRIPIGRGEFYTSTWSPTRYEPTGALTLALGELWGYGGRRSWADGKRQRVEDCLNDVMVGVVAYAEGAREVAREHAERMRTWAEAEVRRVERQRRAAEEAARIKALETAAANWRRSQELSAFIAEVRKLDADASVKFSSNEATDEWLRWADEYALSVDPLRKPLGELLALELG
jgi:hypothetical protein